MNWLSSIFGLFNRGKDYDQFGFYPYKFWQVSPVFNDYNTYIAKIKAVFSNPALLKVICLQCDLFSLGKIVLKKNNIIVENDPILDLLKNPNPFQTQTQFLWDFMFYTMLGNAYIYVDSNIAENENNKLYLLENQKIEFPLSLEKEKDKLVFSKYKLNEINNTKITYRYEDGSSIQIPLSKILTLTDLSNGNGNWFKGYSRIEALYKVISNSEQALDAKNINLRYSGKFFIAGTQDPSNITQMPLSDTEKRDIEGKMNGDKNVHAIKSMVELKRFVSDMKNLELGKAYLEDYFLIGSMYGIQRDVLEAYNSSTYENQEKARGSHVSYTLQPKGDELMNALTTRFGYNNKRKQLCIDWSYLPFMQVFEKDKVDILNKKAITFQTLLKNGVDVPQINEFLGTNFEINVQSNQQEQIIDERTDQENDS